jgi:hypothetical protein
MIFAARNFQFRAVSFSGQDIHALRYHAATVRIEVG